MPTVLTGKGRGWLRSAASAAGVQPISVTAKRTCGVLERLGLIAKMGDRYYVTDTGRSTLKSKYKRRKTYGRTL